MEVLVFLIQWHSFIAWKFMNNNAIAKFHDVEKTRKEISYPPTASSFQINRFKGELAANSYRLDI